MSDLRKYESANHGKFYVVKKAKDVTNDDVMNWHRWIRDRINPKGNVMYIITGIDRNGNVAAVVEFSSSISEMRSLLPGFDISVGNSPCNACKVKLAGPYVEEDNRGLKCISDMHGWKDERDRYYDILGNDADWLLNELEYAPDYDAATVLLEEFDDSINDFDHPVIISDEEEEEALNN